MADFVKKKKLTELEDKVPDVSSLATKTALTAVGNKATNISCLVKKQTITQKLVSLKQNLLIIVMRNILVRHTLATNFVNTTITQANLVIKKN